MAHVRMDKTAHQMINKRAVKALHGSPVYVCIEIHNKCIRVSRKVDPAQHHHTLNCDHGFWATFES